MADAATVNVSATLLPDEIATTLTGSMTVTPDDANDKWYYKLTACTASNTDLIAGYFLDYTAVDDDTAPTAGPGEGGHVGIPLGNHDLVQTQTQRLGRYLGQGRVATRDIHRTSEQAHRAVFVDADRCRRRTAPTAPLTYRYTDASGFLGGGSQLLGQTHSFF